MSEHKYTIKQQDIIAFKRRKYVRAITNAAINRGALVRASECQACGIHCKTQAHHRDYGKPLHVLWLCQKCHSAAHRENHPDNPRNVKQSPLPEAANQHDFVSVSVSLPIDVYLEIHQIAENTNKNISQLIRSEILRKYETNKNQLKFKFMEIENDNAQQVQNKNIQHLGQNEEAVQTKPISRKLSLRTVGPIPTFPTGHGRVSGRL
jgi:hypothetical protein